MDAHIWSERAGRVSDWAYSADMDASKLTRDAAGPV